LCGGVHDVITGNKIGQRSFELQGSENWGLPLTWPDAVTTVQHLRADCDVRPCKPTDMLNFFPLPRSDKVML